MNKLLITASAAIAGLSLSAADAPKKADSNVLWEVTGENIKVSPTNQGNAWRTSAFTIEPTKDKKGFIFKSNPAKKHYSTGKYMKVSPEYPWFCWRIISAKPIPKTYLGLTMGNFSGLGCNQVGMVSRVLPGYYAINIAQDSKLTKPRNAFLRIDQHGFTTTFGYMKMVKKPDYYIEITSESIKAGKPVKPGEEVTFTLNLKDSAEEASLSFYKAYTMPKMKINGVSMLMMKPADKENKVWVAKVKINSLSPEYKKGKPYPRNAIIVKADVELEEEMISVLTSMPAAVDVK